jgi:RimJ/RimL family protein N-acetyltransferase
VGYLLDEEAEGRGVVTTTLRQLLLQPALWTLFPADERLVISTVSDNERSAAVARRLGFVKWRSGNIACRSRERAASVRRL